MILKILSIILWIVAIYFWVKVYLEDKELNKIRKMNSQEFREYEKSKVKQ